MIDGNHLVFSREGTLPAGATASSGRRRGTTTAT